jgi:hypothetical protein
MDGKLMLLNIRNSLIVHQEYALVLLNSVSTNRSPIANVVANLNIVRKRIHLFTIPEKAFIRGSAYSALHLSEEPWGISAKLQ